MATQVLASAPVPVPKSTVPTTEVPLSFQISSQDSRLAGLPAASVKVVAPPLGVLENFTGNFAGTGFNLIFRPNSGQTKFPNPLDPSLPAPPNPPNENVLELNLTTESLSFSSSLGEIPNRGLETQTDIQLNGVPYVQAISDVTNLATGKGDALAAPIHFEPGLWMHVPATTAGKQSSIRLRDMSCTWFRHFPSSRRLTAIGDNDRGWKTPQSTLTESTKLLCACVVTNGTLNRSYFGRNTDTYGLDSAWYDH